jgi:hypothetical protein
MLQHRNTTVQAGVRMNDLGAAITGLCLALVMAWMTLTRTGYTRAFRSLVKLQYGLHATSRLTRISMSFESYVQLMRVGMGIWSVVAVPATVVWAYVSFKKLT